MKYQTCRTYIYTGANLFVLHHYLHCTGLPMSEMNLSVRELEESDIALITRYWLNSDPTYLGALGVDMARMPAAIEWETMLKRQLEASYEQKQSFCMIWLLDERPAGHSNINKIVYGREAYMHMHLWNKPERQNGLGARFVRLTLPYFFTHYRLQTLFCEPYALNPAPNKTLAKAGFCFRKSYTTTPGSINFEQPVNLWEMDHATFQRIYLSSE